MKHNGKAARSALKMIGMSLAAVGLLLVAAFLGKVIGTFVLDDLAGVLAGLWLLFALFTFYFFRDPDPMTPSGPNLVVSPGHGKVDTIDTIEGNEFMEGRCRRISIFLSVFDVHVQNSPVTGVVGYFKHTPGQYLNAMRTDCAQYNENVLIGIQTVENGKARVGVRLIAGLIARRIVPWVNMNETVMRGERIGLIQFGSRVDLYLPLDSVVKVHLGDKVVGGTTVLAELSANHG